MKKNRLVKVLTSAALTAAMVMSMGGMSAFAAPIRSIDLGKTVTTDGNTYAPNTSFVFEVVIPSAPSSSTIELNGNPFYAGIEGGLKFDAGKNSIGFTPGTLADNYTDKTNLTIDAGVFERPGVYQYQVKETPGDLKGNKYDGIDYDDTTKNVFLYVEYEETSPGVYADTLSVTKVIVQDEGKSAKSEAIAFTNNYGAGDDPEKDKVHDLIVTKNVTGNQGDKTKEFNFEVAVSGAEGEWYKIEKTDKSGHPVDIKVGNATVTYLVSQADAIAVPLKDGESIHIYGLSVNDTYTVNETEANLDGYTTTVKIGDAAPENGGAVTEAKLNADGTQIIVENNKNVSTPTGIILSFAPYILLVAIAGVFAVSFLRKKREEF